MYFVIDLWFQFFKIIWKDRFFGDEVFKVSTIEKPIVRVVLTKNQKSGGFVKEHFATTSRPLTKENIMVLVF